MQKRTNELMCVVHGPFKVFPLDKKYCRILNANFSKILPVNCQVYSWYYPNL